MKTTVLEETFFFKEKGRQSQAKAVRRNHALSSNTELVCKTMRNISVNRLTVINN